ncbi:molybdopterin-binding protein [Streptomyces virginiae]|uniref:TOBE domain-containing protein n=1 Tax=Streptomyces virginiae TaxID=1961 RepID=UPI0032457E30
MALTLHHTGAAPSAIAGSAAACDGPAGGRLEPVHRGREVALATGPVEGISIRNQLAGTVTDVATGGAMGSVKVSVEGGELTAAITKDAVEALGLASGTSVVALIKSTEISLAAA